MPEMVRAYDAAGEEKRSATRDMWSFKEWVVLPFETNPLKGTVLLGDLREWKVLRRACWGRERRCFAPVIRTDLSSAARYF